MIVITFGTFDLLHIGHINMLNNCKKHGDKLIVGVSSNKLNYEKKSRYPIFNQDDRMNIIGNIKGVDEVFLEESLELKREYIKKYNDSGEHLFLSQQRHHFRNMRRTTTIGNIL